MSRLDKTQRYSGNSLVVPGSRHGTSSSNSRSGSSDSRGEFAPLQRTQRHSEFEEPNPYQPQVTVIGQGHRDYRKYLYVGLRIALFVVCLSLAIMSLISLILTVLSYNQLKAIYETESLTFAKYQILTYHKKMIPFYLLMGLSFLLLVTNLCGCGGAWWLETMLLNCFIAMLLFGVIGTAVAMIMYSEYKDKVDPELESLQLTYLSEFYATGKLDSSNFLDYLVDKTQEGGCCGFVTVNTTSSPSGVHPTLLFWTESTQWGARQVYVENATTPTKADLVPTSCCKQRNCNVTELFEYHFNWEKEKEAKWVDLIHPHGCDGNVATMLFRSLGTKIIVIGSLVVVLILSALLMAIFIRCTAIP